MVRIKHIRIKNFRSIVNLDTDVGDISVFIGLNDAGKSNVLKALNLFFNGETEPGKKYNPELQYHVAWSNECIEFWFILHFDYYISNNHRSEYINYLTAKFKELGFGSYEKNRADTFRILRKYGREDLAIRYARRIIEENEGKTPVEISPGTKVYELVEELGKYCENNGI